MRLNLTDVQKHCHATLEFSGNSKDIIILGASSDSRTVSKGDIFVCINGEQSDGHSHAKSAIENGAVALLAEYNPYSSLNEPSPVPVLLVSNTVKALGLLAQDYRKNFQGTVVGITGSAGKTTLKEMLAHVLSFDTKKLVFDASQVARNPLNLNTQIGMPISILATNTTEKFWVFEAGINQPHDMDELGTILKPNLAVILNIGTAHTEGLGDKGVAYYKAQLAKYTTDATGTNTIIGKTVLANADYPALVKEIEKICPAIYFSTKDTSKPYYASYQGKNEFERGVYEVHIQKEIFTIQSHFVGSYGAENIAAVAGAAHLLGYPAKLIAEILRNLPAPNLRFKSFIMQGQTIIDDCYNANPLSTVCMLESTKELAGEHPLCCVLGEMKELGTLAQPEHKKLGRFLAKINPLFIFWVGNHAQDVKEGLNEGNFAGKFTHLSSPEDFEQHLDSLPSDAFILFKGSRSIKVENYLACLKRKYHAV